MNWFRLASIVFLMLAMLLLASPVVYADDPPDDDPDVEVDIETSSGLEVDIGVSGSSDAVIDIDVSGDFGVDIKATGPAELNVGVEGPSEVHIDAGDEVKLNVEASDESQVFVGDHSLDNPAQKPDEPAGYQEIGHNDPSLTYQESGDVDEHSSRFDSLPIISGVFPAAGLLAFFLIRRKAKNKTRQLNNEQGEEDG